MRAGPCTLLACKPSMSPLCVNGTPASFSLLQYSELNDKMALITRTVSAAFQDVAYFLTLAFIVFSVFALVGHLLFGGELSEWSSLGRAFNTAWDLVLGNYAYTELEPAMETVLQAIVMTIYFYSYMLLLMLLLMNLLIAILMDGYANAKGVAESAVEEALRYNVGPLLPHVKLQLRGLVAVPRYHLLWLLHRVGLPVAPPEDTVKWVQWNDEKWMVSLRSVQNRLREDDRNPRQCEMGRLIAYLVLITGEDRKEVIKQVYHQFQDRHFRRPTDAQRPFEEPDTDKYVKEISQLVKGQDLRSRELLKMSVQMTEALEKANTGVEYMTKKLVDAGIMGEDELAELKAAEEPAAGVRTTQRRLLRHE